MYKNMQYNHLHPHVHWRQQDEVVCGHHYHRGSCQLYNATEVTANKNEYIYMKTI